MELTFIGLTIVSGENRLFDYTRDILHASFDSQFFIRYEKVQTITSIVISVSNTLVLYFILLNIFHNELDNT